MLYLGAAIGLAPGVLRSGAVVKAVEMSSENKLRLLGAILLGGVAGPLALLFGLRIAEASSVSMWLNLELVFTALLGHFIFKDYLGRAGWIGSLGVVIAAGILSWNGGVAGIQAGLLVALACLFWGFDNHFTALIDELSPRSNTFFKGIFAGSINLIIGLSVAGGYGGSWEQTIFALVVGFFSYGLSIALYISSAQGIGATRAQIIFASAPFFGVGASLIFLGESLSVLQILAAGLFGLSLIPLLLDSHLHEHYHGTVVHDHLHTHNESHHDHSHETGPVFSFLPHSHEHEHESKTHAHTHFPDIHHRHDHDDS